MNQVVEDGHREVIDLNNNSDGLGKVESMGVLNKLCQTEKKVIN